MASADNPIHAVELAEAPDSSKSEVIEPTEEEWELYDKYVTQKLIKKYKDYIPKKQFRHEKFVSCCALSPSAGDELVTCSWDKTAILWDMRSGKIIRTFEGHTNFLSGVCISSSGDELVTCSWDKTAILWDMKTGKKIRTFEGHTEGVNAVCISS